MSAAYDVNKIGATRFWKVRNEPYADDVRLVDGWYWQDDDCEEPMGPFNSKAEAQADHRELRPQSSSEGHSND